MKRTLCKLIFMFLAGCAPNSMEDFQHEGEALTRHLIEELREVQNRKDLAQAAPKLKVLFDKLVDLIIEARTFQEMTQEESVPFPNEESELLLTELKRIYHIEAGRETIESVQREALIRLDAFEKSLKKKREKLSK